MWVLEECFPCVTFMPGRVWISQDPVSQSCNGIDHGKGGHFSARENEVTETHQIIHMGAYPFVDPLVVPTKKSDVLMFCQFCSEVLVEDSAFRAHLQDANPGCAISQVLDASHDGAHLHDHPSTSAKWKVIHRVVFVFREVSNIGGFNRDVVIANGPPNDGRVRRTLEKLGEEGEKVKVLHGLIPDESFRGLYVDRLFCPFNLSDGVLEYRKQHLAQSPAFDHHDIHGGEHEALDGP